MRVIESSKRTMKRLPSEEYDHRLKMLRAESEKMCRGMFEFIDAQGGFIEFSYRQFPGEPILTIKINHGEIVDIPMGIVKQLNNSKKKIRKFGYKDGHLPDKGLPSTFELVSRVRFTPMDVLGDLEVKNNKTFFENVVNA